MVVFFWALSCLSWASVRTLLFRPSKNEKTSRNSSIFWKRPKKRRKNEEKPKKRLKARFVRAAGVAFSLFEHFNKG